MVTATEQIQQARDDLTRARETYGRGSGYSHDAYQRLHRIAHELGRPLDALSRYSSDESERFFARTVPGPDGHVYWTGGRHFHTNGDRQRMPRRWWWEHKHGVSLDRYKDEFSSLCGDRKCINPEHHAVGNRTRARFTESQLIGFLQVDALRRGRAASQREWDQAGHPITSGGLMFRFGTWVKTLRAAGLDPPGQPAATPESCKDALRFVRDRLGHWPSQSEFEAHRDELLAAGHPTAVSTIVRRLSNSWPDAIRRASGP